MAAELDPQDDIEEPAEEEPAVEEEEILDVQTLRAKQMTAIQKIAAQRTAELAAAKKELAETKRKLALASQKGALPREDEPKKTPGRKPAPHQIVAVGEEQITLMEWKKKLSSYKRTFQTKPSAIAALKYYAWEQKTVLEELDRTPNDIYCEVYEAIIGPLPTSL